MNFGTFIILIGLAGVGFLVWQLMQELRRAQENKAEDKSLLMLQEQLNQLRQTFQTGLKSQDKTMSDQMNVSQKSLEKQFAITSQIAREVTENVKDVTQKLTQLQETNKQIASFAEQMRSLENILKNPKQRGVLGEFFLENLLSQELPPTHFEMQYRFENGDIVDAVIKVRDQLIPVDAKFSLENYNRLMNENNDVQRVKLEREFKIDLKKRIEETSKYVRQKERTTDFAFMFIPADGIFYNLLSYKIGTIEINTKDLIEYAFEKRVILVSPMTFYAYLQTVMHGLKALVIEKRAVEIQKRVGDLGRHLNAYEDYFKKLGSHLGTTISTYNSASNEFRKIDKDVCKITEGIVGGDAEAMLLEKPQSYDSDDVTVTVKELKAKEVL